MVLEDDCDRGIAVQVAGEGGGEEGEYFGRGNRGGFGECGGGGEEASAPGIDGLGGRREILDGMGRAGIVGISGCRGVLVFGWGFRIACNVGKRGWIWFGRASCL